MHFLSAPVEENKDKVELKMFLKHKFYFSDWQGDRIGRFFCPMGDCLRTLGSYFKIT
jgi:hypothetical protein